MDTALDLLALSRRVIAGDEVSRAEARLLFSLEGEVLRHLDGILIPEEVRRVQHIDMQRVAFDPLTAVDEPAQCAQLAVNRDAERLLNRVHGTHLVRDWADAANPRSDARHFRKRPAFTEFLEAAHLGYVEVRVGDFALVVHLDGDLAVALETRYIHEWSIWADLAILARTVGVVVRMKGAL